MFQVSIFHCPVRRRHQLHMQFLADYKYDWRIYITMINIELDNIKNFMSHLFIKDTFDHFLCRELRIDTFVSFKIDGTLQKDFLNDIEKAELSESSYTPWSMLKPYCFNMIKGSRTPLSMKLVFSMPRHSIESFIAKNVLNTRSDAVTGLYINIRYENKQLSVITGTSLSSFTLDKSMENAWDTAVEHFIKKTQGQ